MLCTLIGHMSHMTTSHSFVALLVLTLLFLTTLILKVTKDSYHCLVLMSLYGKMRKFKMVLRCHYTAVGYHHNILVTIRYYCDIAI